MVSFPHHVKGYDPKSGKVLWQCNGLSQIVSSTVVIKDGIAVAIAIGAITLERPAGEEFDSSTFELCEDIAALLGPGTRDAGPR